MKTNQGIGVGLRPQHYLVITSDWPAMDWFEAVTENYMDSGGRPVQILEEVRKHYPVALHGVSLSIGSADPLRPQYLERLKALAGRIEPFIVSDHLCWASVDGHELHDLLPLPFTEEAVTYIADRVQQVQDFLGRQILLENVSSYVTYTHSTIPEWEFLKEIALRSGCGILLDLNNIYVNSKNHGFAPLDYLKGIPGQCVGQFHLAGHTDKGDYLFDTHSDSVASPVWDLYRQALELWGPVSTLIEWDENIPAFERLSAEAEKAREIYLSVIASGAKQSKLQRDLDCFVAKSAPCNDNTSSDKNTKLSEIQHAMRLKIEASGSGGDDIALNHQAGVPGIERLSIYAGGYMARTQEALQEVYEAAAHVLGAEVFHELAHDYAKAYPSTNYNLTYLGRHLPEFLKSWEGAKELPFLSDLAALEWEIAMAFHAFDEPPADSSKLADLSIDDWENTRLVFQPSVSIVKSAWPVLDIWNVRKKPPEKIRVELLNRPQNVLVSRRGWEPQCRLIQDAECQMLETLMNRQTLGAACEEASGEVFAVSEWFAAWNSGGLIARFETGKP